MAETTLTRIPRLAQFNKLNKVFITILGMVDDINMLNHEHYLYHEIMIDEENEKLIGNYDNYQIVSLASQPLEIFEGHLNALASEKILSEYPMGRQLNILGSILAQLADAAGIPADELKAMNDYINEVRQANALRKEFYNSNPDYQYISTEQFEELYAKKLEGGIVEYAPVVTNL